MEDHYELNIAYNGMHWARVHFSSGTQLEEVMNKSRTLMVAMGLEYEYSLTYWQGRGKTVDLLDGGWSLVKAVYKDREGK